MASHETGTSSGLGGDKQIQLWVAFLVTLIVAVVVVGLRLLARGMSKARFGLDDYLIVVATINLLALNAVGVVSIKAGLGLPYKKGNPESIHEILRLTFIAEFLYTTLLCFVKFSVLAFYWRTFNSKFTRWLIYILGAITTIWGLAVLCMYLLQCRPVDEFWIRSNPALCPVEEKRFMVISAIPNIATDVGLLALPMFHIWNIQKSVSQKVALSCVFALGGITLFASVARLVAAVRADFIALNVSWVLVDFLLWSVVEAGTAIIAACLPFLRPLYVLLADKKKQRSSVMSKNVCASRHSASSRSRWSSAQFTGHTRNLSFRTVESESTDPSPIKIKMVWRNGKYEYTETETERRSYNPNRPTSHTLSLSPQTTQNSHQSQSSQETLIRDPEKAYNRQPKKFIWEEPHGYE